MIENYEGFLLRGGGLGWDGGVWSWRRHIDLRWRFLSSFQVMAFKIDGTEGVAPRQQEGLSTADSGSQLMRVYQVTWRGCIL